MLRYTSCLFSTIVIQAYHRRRALADDSTLRLACYHHIFLAVLALSILFHCTRDPRIGVVDRALAHLAFGFVVWCDSRRAIDEGAAWLLAFPLAVACLWVAQRRWPTMAVSSCCGVFGQHM